MKQRNFKILIIVLASQYFLTPAYADGEADDYSLSGKVTGVMATLNRCYLAVDDPEDKKYSNGWHMASNGNHCKIAQLAFMTNQSVTVGVKDGAVPSDTNDVTKIIMSSSSIKWPPYR